MKNRVIRIVAALSLIAGLQPVVAQDEAKPLVVIDLRPDEEKEGHGLAPLTGKCNDDVFRIADVATDPLKVDVLKGDLESLMGMEGKTLTVLNWSIYYNKQVQKGGMGLKGIGVQGYSVPTKDDKKKAGSKCSKKESAGGWYEAKEITSVYFPIISEFTGTFAGKPVNVRVVYSPRAKLPGKFEGETADAEALLEAVHQTSEAVATAILQ
jgi:hypothetical protein